VRYRREVDTVAGVLLLVALWLAVSAWWTGTFVEEPVPSPSLTDRGLEEWSRATAAAEDRALARQDAWIAGAGLAMTAVALLVAGRGRRSGTDAGPGTRVGGPAGSPSARTWEAPAAAALLVVGAAGSAWVFLALPRAVVRAQLVPDTAWLAILGPLVLGVVATSAAAVVMAAALLRRGRAAEAAAGGVVAWGATTLVLLVAAPGHWFATSRGRGDDLEVAGILGPAAVAATCLAPAAALLAVSWLRTPASGADVAARGRGACLVVAVLLLADAAGPARPVLVAEVFDGERWWWAAPQAALLLAAAALAAGAAVRWRQAPALTAAAAVAGAAAVAVWWFGADHHPLPGSPTPLVTGLVVPVTLAAAVLWAARRRATDRTREAEPEPATT
jgi:hypothetical protein